MSRSENTWGGLAEQNVKIDRNRPPVDLANGNAMGSLLVVAEAARGNPLPATAAALNAIPKNKTPTTGLQ